MPHRINNLFTYELIIRMKCLLDAGLKPVTTKLQPSALPANHHNAQWNVMQLKKHTINCLFQLDI